MARMGKKSSPKRPKVQPIPDVPLEETACGHLAGGGTGGGSTGLCRRHPSATMRPSRRAAAHPPSTFSATNNTRVLLLHQGAVPCGRAAVCCGRDKAAAAATLPALAYRSAAALRPIAASSRSRKGMCNNVNSPALISERQVSIHPSCRGAVYG